MKSVNHKYFSVSLNQFVIDWQKWNLAKFISKIYLKIIIWVIYSDGFESSANICHAVYSENLSSTVNSQKTSACKPAVGIYYFWKYSQWQLFKMAISSWLPQITHNIFYAKFPIFKEIQKYILLCFVPPLSNSSLDKLFHCVNMNKDTSEKNIDQCRIFSYP